MLLKSYEGQQRNLCPSFPLENGGESGKGLPGLYLSSQSHGNSSGFGRWERKSWGRGSRGHWFQNSVYPRSSLAFFASGYMTQLSKASCGLWLADSVAVFFPFLFPSLCQISPPTTPIIRCHMHGVGLVPEFTDFRTRRDGSVIEPGFLHSAGHLMSHHCFSAEPNQFSSTELLQNAGC